MRFAGEALKGRGGFAGGLSAGLRFDRLAGDVVECAQGGGAGIECDQLGADSVDLGNGSFDEEETIRMNEVEDLGEAEIMEGTELKGGD